MLLKPNKTWKTWFYTIKHGEMPENQAKRVEKDGQNHTNFGLIKYPQTYLLLVLEQNNHKQTPKDMHWDISEVITFLWSMYEAKMKRLKQLCNSENFKM